ncbi:hypothetical protein KNP414_06364 [Paenibacillus mucilaginosus KNP414]|uniref:Uncharacterized protein n=1 Tax=Paenibacillus mucilaginosus (strain KNP414) TaxID=1036673 RepID=F8FLW9_PAEMK|nr:hypothetical protein KNP414_06364 [Paenibacillus mucilaginosus KNP414]
MTRFKRTTFAFYRVSAGLTGNGQADMAGLLFISYVFDKFF